MQPSPRQFPRHDWRAYPHSSAVSPPRRWTWGALLAALVGAACLAVLLAVFVIVL